MFQVNSPDGARRLVLFDDVFDCRLPNDVLHWDRFPRCKVDVFAGSAIHGEANFSSAASEEREDNVFERYTERARGVILFGRYEANVFGSTTIETEHLLLGLLREDKNLMSRFLRNSTSAESIRKDIEARVEIHPKVSTSIDLPLSNACKRVLVYANEEAERMKHQYIGTEHLLLGMLRDETCMAAEILRERGLRLEAIREELAYSSPDASTDSSEPVTPPVEPVLLVLGTHRFTAPMEHFTKALLSSGQQDWPAAVSELQVFLDSLLNDIKMRLQERGTGLENVEWVDSLRAIRSGLSSEEDWNFRRRLALLIAEVLLKRYQQRLNS